MGTVHCLLSADEETELGDLPKVTELVSSRPSGVQGPHTESFSLKKLNVKCCNSQNMQHSHDVQPFLSGSFPPSLILSLKVKPFLSSKCNVKPNNNNTIIIIKDVL